MKTFRTALTFALLSLTLVGCGDDESAPVETIGVETTPDAGISDAQPAPDPANPDAPHLSKDHCRDVPKLGRACFR